eukprot:s103_g55.t1
MPEALVFRGAYYGAYRCPCEVKSNATMGAAERLHGQHSQPQSCLDGRSRQRAINFACSKFLRLSNLTTWSGNLKLNSSADFVGPSKWSVESHSLVMKPQRFARGSGAPDMRRDLGRGTSLARLLVPQSQMECCYVWRMEDIPHDVNPAFNVLNHHQIRQSPLESWQPPKGLQGSVTKRHALAGGYSHQNLYQQGPLRRDDGGLALRIAELLDERKSGPGSGPWFGKCLDLSKAYKQMGVHPQHRHLSVIFYHDLQGKPKYFVANSLMFGSTAAVYSFNRMSRSLWYLFNRMLVIPSGVFYDDFPMFAPAPLAEDSDAAASQLLHLLGWRHAKTGTKACPFQSKFQVLGCTLDLAELERGAVVLENKPGRIDRLVTLLNQIKGDKKLSKHQGQVFHGLMRYACGFFSGKFLHQVCAEVLALSGPKPREGLLI